MSKETMDPVTSSTTKSGHSLTGNIKMFILPPNLLQNICANDSVKKDQGTISDLKDRQKHPINSCSPMSIKAHIKSSTTTNSEDSANNTDSVNLMNTTEVPMNRNNKNLMLKPSPTREEKKNLCSKIKKQKHNITEDKSADYSRSHRTLRKGECSVRNVKNNKTTSNDVPKPQKNNCEEYLSVNINKLKGAHHENEINTNLIKGTTRFCKQNKFSDQIISNKKETSKNISPDKKKSDSPRGGSRKSTISETPAASTSQSNHILKYIKCTKEEHESKSYEKKIIVNNPDTCVTPAIIKDTLPLSSSDSSGTPPSISNMEKKRCIKSLKNCNNVSYSKSSKNLKDIKGNNHQSCKTVDMESINASVLDDGTVKENDLGKPVKGEKTGNLIDININAKETRSNLIPNTSNQDTSNTNAKDHKNNNETFKTTPITKRRGRPRKVVSVLQEKAHFIGESEISKNLDNSQEMNDVSIAEKVAHSRRHIEKSYNISCNDGLSDNSSSHEDNIPNSITAKWDGSADIPADTCTSRSRGRGKGRGKGWRKGSHISTLDTEYIPKLQGPINAGKTRDKNLNQVDLVMCAKCEIDVPKKQWSSHNLLKHNNMSWVKGDEPMDFENDIKLWRKVLMAAIKKRKGQLSCEKCGTVKRSANGFISHMQFCGKSDEEKQALMVTCPVCGAVLMPSSMEMHERIHRQSEQNKTKKIEFNTNENERLKRKAAEKAVTKILEFAELVKDDNGPPEKKIKLQPSLLKSIVKAPDSKRGIPSVWKGIWKKQLLKQEKITCRQLGCTYTSTTFEDMCEHFSKCNFTPQECYVCKICKFSTPSNDEMLKHVSEQHATEEEIDQGSDFEGEGYSSDEKSNYTMKFGEKEQGNKGRLSDLKFQTIEWTMEFEQKNYKLHLFSEHIPNRFRLLKNNEAEKYFPKLELSMRTRKEKASGKFGKTETPWKQWKRFEGGLDDGTPTFFVGGPVWALACLPIPSPMYSKEPSQYIAISTHPTMESTYTVGKSHSGKNMIQIWNAGPLNLQTNNKKQSPALSYAITHHNGTIWSLEWCPSGCYQDESLNNFKKKNDIKSSLRRMGMLAAASSDGNVYIYSLPFPEELQFEKTQDNEWPIYHTDPVIILVVNIAMYDNNNQNWQCTKLSWTKERGHNIIAAGFSNGYIAVWDLSYKSPLSMQKRQNTYFINAFQHFYAHGNAVSMVAIVPYNGERFLASGSIDRTYKFWDLENISTPQTYLQKGIIVGGAWMTHWPSAIITFDDAFSYKHTNTYLISLREREFKYYNLLGTNSAAYALGVSDYANSIAHGTLAGEILTIFALELIHGKDIDRALYKRRKLSSFIRIMDFSEPDSNNKRDKKDKKNSKEYHYLPETYHECKDRFGITFCDNLRDNEQHAKRQSLCADKLTGVPIEEYPFMSVNRISWNPNPWSYLWMAVGYQNGLVRLLNFKYMAHDLKILLPQHAKCMLNKSEETAEECC